MKELWQAKFIYEVEYTTTGLFKKNKKITLTGKPDTIMLAENSEQAYELFSHHADWSFVPMYAWGKLNNHRVPKHKIISKTMDLKRISASMDTLRLLMPTDQYIEYCTNLIARKWKEAMDKYKNA